MKYIHRIQLGRDTDDLQLRFDLASDLEATPPNMHKIRKAAKEKLDKAFVNPEGNGYFLPKLDPLGEDAILYHEDEVHLYVAYSTEDES